MKGSNSVAEFWRGVSWVPKIAMVNGDRKLNGVGEYAKACSQK